MPSFRIPLHGASQDAVVRGLYDPATAGLLAKIGTPEIRRASHVDVTPDLREVAQKWLQRHGRDALQPVDWWADMLPVNGPVLGPYSSRDAALQAELAWLEEHNLPVPQ